MNLSTVERCRYDNRMGGSIITASTIKASQFFCHYNFNSVIRKILPYLSVLYPENLKGIDETSGLKVSFTTGDAYLTAGSNVYKLNNPVPFDTLENGSFYQIYKTKAGLFLVTDKHLRVSGSTSQMTIVKGNTPCRFFNQYLRG